MRLLKLLSVVLSGLVLASIAMATPCTLPDNGSGTVNLPPACPDGYQGPMTIVDGLPPGTTMEIDATLTDFLSVVTTPGGNLGGEVHECDATLVWVLAGTGELEGFQRNLWIPVHCVLHSGPRNPGDPVQNFPMDLFQMYGELFGDPDFCSLRVRAGTDFGLPSPGQTTLTRLPTGNFAVDSFFDISYQIEFEGCPGSVLEDLMGTTTDSDVFRAGEPYTTHSCVLPDNGSGTIDLPPECPDGYQGPMAITAGLPMGSTLEIDATLTDFLNVVRTPGGSLGGEIQEFDASLGWLVTGTGDFTGFQRSLWIPVHGIVHTGPRNPGDPIQTFPMELVQLSGQLFGDPDFCELIVTAGLDYGLPSPGQTTLTEISSGYYAVDSFFDITYQIQFEGCPGSILDGMFGTTTGTDHFHAGEPYFTHSCVLPDNGSGTVDMPPECPDGYQGPMAISGGLPPGSPLEIDATLTDFLNIVRIPGGSLGGEVQEFDASLSWFVSGTGVFSGFYRNLWIPVHCVVHTGPRNPGDPVQTFPMELIQLSGQLFGDPDFCELIVTAGLDYGLPSPGQTTLTELPSGDYAVDSFFDITYQIQFQGCPGSMLDGMFGTTTGTDHFHAGEVYDTAVGDRPQDAPFVLHQNNPNPFNPVTIIQYDVPWTGGMVRLEIFDVRGRLVRTLVNEIQPAGRQEVIWDGKDAQGGKVASGVYLYALRTDQGTLVRKMAMIK